MTSSTNNENFMNDTIKDNKKKVGVTSGKNKGESEEILPFCLKYLTPDMIKEAETNLHETEENKTGCLREFRNFIQNQKNLVTPIDDLFLVSFLRARKYDLERTYKLFLNFWKFRKDNRVYLDNINTEALLSLLLRNIFGYLEHRDKKGASVVVFKIGEWNPELDAFETMFIAIFFIFMISLEYDANHIAGMRLILDYRGLSWTQMKYFTPSTISLFVKGTQFCFPGRYKGIHVITDRSFFKVLWAVAYTMLSRKIKERVFIHTSDLKPIQNYIHPSVLPVDFGGDASAFETSKRKDYYIERIKRFLEFIRYGYKDLQTS